MPARKRFKAFRGAVMKETPTLDYVLLALMKIHPRITGYQLKAIITQSTQYFFKAHLSQIYPRLKAMLANKWVSCEIEPQKGKPDRKLYSLTPLGDEMLNDWLCEPFDFERTRDSFDKYFVKMLFIGPAEDEVLRTYLEQGIDFLEQERNAVEESNLGPEKEFLSEQSEHFDDYLYLWQKQNDYILDEFLLQINWLKTLYKEKFGKDYS
jgi:DNA-binding PadR family transcriptional regulator